VSLNIVLRIYRKQATSHDVSQILPHIKPIPYKKYTQIPGGIMKHFLPSSIMLTPFLVKYYDKEPEENEISEAEPTHSLTQPELEIILSNEDEPRR
jgi:hypothetical protein|tara:strand:+ start:115 stop:402 length:288 start_codon:yes stop_codon:yes gene_type:complete